MSLCVLALPLDLSVSDFCTFLGGYSQQVRHLRFLRQNGAQAACLALLTFKSQESADEFFNTFNSKPVVVLACHIVCLTLFAIPVSCAFVDQYQCLLLLAVLFPGAAGAVSPCICQGCANHQRAGLHQSTKSGYVSACLGCSASLSHLLAIRQPCV